MLPPRPAAGAGGGARSRRLDGVLRWPARARAAPREQRLSLWAVRPRSRRTLR